MMSDWSLLVIPHLQLPENDTFYRVHGVSTPHSWLKGAAEVFADAPIAEHKF